MKIVAIGGGFSYGPLGYSHHATEDLAILRAIPDVTVVAPGCDWEVAAATDALIETPGTCYFQLDKSSAGNTRRPGEEFRLGRGRAVSLHTGKPMDGEFVVELARTHEALLVEEHSVIGGLGGAVAEVLMDAGVHPAGWKRLGLREGFSSIVGSQEYLRGRYGLDAEAVVAAAGELLRA